MILIRKQRKMEQFFILAFMVYVSEFLYLLYFERGMKSAIFILNANNVFVLYFNIIRSDM